MRLISLLLGAQARIGVLLDDHSLLDLNQAAPHLPTDLGAFLALGDSAWAAAQAEQRRADPGAIRPLGAVRFLGLIPKPGKILCIGHNYQGHIGIGRSELPEYPNMFCKTANTIIGHQEAILLPAVSAQVDYEAELAVIIGRRGRCIPETEALDYVAGYSIFNDVSARDYQKRTTQWFLGKSFDTFGPLGPALVTPDEIPNPHNLALELTVNGVAKQRAHTRDLIFSVPFLVSYLSQALTLEPGDIIATGTPAKLPEAANPQVFLQPGDVVEVRIEGLGVLRNEVRRQESGIRD